MKIIFFISVLFLSHHVAHSKNDSLTKKHYKVPTALTYSSSVSASYVAYKNWKYNGINNFAFLMCENFNFDTIGNHWETHSRFNGELGFMKLKDSAWYKNSDYLDFSLELVKIKNKTLMNVFTFCLNSQFLSTYENTINDSGTFARTWVAGFGNPMCMDLTAGSEIKFWKNCRINLNYVTLRTSTSPTNEATTEITSTDFIYKKCLITSEYGLSLQTFIRHNFNSRIRLENHSRFFANAINPNHIDIDFRNKLIIRILKYLDLILDSRIRYMPKPPYKFQFRNELMLSFSLEK